MKLVQKGLLCILVTLLLEGSCAGILLVLHNQAQQGAQRVSRSKDRISVEDSAMAGVLDLTLCTVSGLAAGKSPKAKAQEFAGRISEDLYKLKQMPSKDQEQQKKIEEFENAVTELVNLELRLCDAVNDDGLELPYIGSTLIRGEVRKRVDKLIQIKRSLQEMESKEKLSSADSESLSFYAVASVVVVNMILLLALAFVFLRGIGARLSRIVANAHRFSKNEPLADPLKGKDEIAELDRSFHEMADIVKAATQKQRAMIENAVDVICSVNEFGAFTAVSP